MKVRNNTKKAEKYKLVLPIDVYPEIRRELDDYFAFFKSYKYSKFVVVKVAEEVIRCIPPSQ